MVELAEVMGEVEVVLEMMEGVDVHHKLLTEPGLKFSRLAPLPDKLWVQ